MQAVANAAGPKLGPDIGVYTKPTTCKQAKRRAERRAALYAYKNQNHPTKKLEKFAPERKSVILCTGETSNRFPCVVHGSGYV